jgi:GH3 auxin-responsive promoter
MNLRAAIANSLWLASNLLAWARFRRALNHPAETQTRLLHDYLTRNADTEFGKAYRLAEIKNYEEFARRVPLNDYEDLTPWINRIRRDENRVLTSGAVTHFIPTSGSSGARKLIPFTRELQREFNHAISAWIADLYRTHPSVVLGPAYWSISPVIKIEDSESSTVPVGFDDDTAYVGGTRRQLVNAIMAAPSELRLVSDMEQFRYLTLLCLLRQQSLRLISIWHPSFLSLLLDALPRYWEDLLRDIESGVCRYVNLLPPTVIRSLKLHAMPERARQLRNANPADPKTIWPHLEIISCWGDGHAKLAKADLERRFPAVFIESKGLLATECVVTIPFSNSFPLAIHSHFFEFVDEEGRVCLGHELKENRIYEVVVTTGGGLWRYRLHDQIEVTGFVGLTPSLRFLGRAGNISDYCGEKLSEHFVAQAIHEAVGASSPKFAMLAPDEGPRGLHYTLYVEGDVQSEVAARLDALLLQNPHYAWCRKSGQLGPLELFWIRTAGYELFVTREQSHGKRLGEIKPRSLSRETGWSQYFQGYPPADSAMFQNGLHGVCSRLPKLQNDEPAIFRPTSA